MIDVRRLSVLREVARQGSFNRAAAVLRLTPSAVSQQISALERTLGTDVVRRSTRGIELTDAGRVLTETSDSINAELAYAQRRITRLGADTRETLTVATFTSGGQRLLPAALTRFAARHPGVDLTVLENEPADSLTLVREGAADLALAYHFDGPPPVRPGDRTGLTWTPLLADPMWVALPAGHPLATAESLSVADLAAERWVHGCVIVDELLRRYAAMAGFEPRVACRSTDYVFAQSLVRAGIGIAMIPRVALTTEPGLSTVPLRQPCPSRFIGIVTARRAQPHPLAELLIAALHDTAATLPG